jgi:hypothetical protein
MNAVLRIKEATESFRRLECFPIAFTLPEIAFEMVVDEVATPERMGGWIESANTEREPSKYFGPISTEKVAEILFGTKADQEQREQAAILLRNRFVDEHMEEIRQIVAENRREL